MGVTYRHEEDHLVPNFTPPNEGNRPIGIWGQQHLKYLKQHHKIAYFLDTGKVVSVSRERKTTVQIGDIDLNTKIESNFVCTEKHRAFFKEHIGSTFSFNVAFQKWLKSNTGKTYKEAIAAYYQILEEKKKGKTTIDRQFEYNTYIRDFFADNQGKSLEEAIKCWKYKKQMQGHNRYERTDLIALE